MNLHLDHAEFPVIEDSAAVLTTVREAVAAEGYTWGPTGPTGGVASKGAADPVGSRPTGSAKTQIDIQVTAGILRTQRLSRGNHKGFVGVVQVQQDHRRIATATREALSRADLLR